MNNGQPRHKVSTGFDIDAVSAACRADLSQWETCRLMQGAQPFSGGVWDSWPNRSIQVFACLDAELEAIKLHIQAEHGNGRNRT